MRQLRPDYATWQDPRTSVVVSFPVPASDSGVVRALRAGHPGAIRALSERYSGNLLRIASRILGPDRMLEHVVTRAVRRALTNIDQLEDATKLRVWLISHVVRATRRRLRFRRYERLLKSTRISQALTAHAPTGKSANTAEPFSEQLLASYRVLERMNDEQRIVFCLVIIHALSLAEVATVLEISLIACRSLLDKACAGFMRHCQREPMLQRLTIARQIT